MKGEYSYFIPAQRCLFGPEAARCEAKWEELGLANPGRYDGVSLMPDGRWRLVVQDFFSSAFRVLVHDLETNPE